MKYSIFTILFFIHISTSQAQIWDKVIGSRGGSGEKLITGEYVPTVAEINKMRSDVAFLSSERLGGREAGSQGEILAGMHIEKRMGDIGLKTQNNSFRKHFKYVYSKDFSPEIRFMIGGKHLFIPEDCFPFAFSNEKDIQDFFLPESREAYAPWVVPLYQSTQEAQSSIFDWEKSAYEIALNAQKRGASSVFLYDSYDSKYPPKFFKSSIFETLKIPVIFISNKAYKAHIKDVKTITEIQLSLAYKKGYQNATNILGIINNHATENVLVISHYDHLGINKDDASYKKGNTYYPGANNNASGVAVMLNLAEKLNNSNYKKYNYVFIAFSAHEADMQGVKAYIEDKSLDKNKIAYVINFDMVGHLNAQQKLYIGGTNTSTLWKRSIRSIEYSPLKFDYSKPEFKKSDYSIFIEHQIPALHFHTGMTPDWNKPTDTAQKLNYEGMAYIADAAYKLIGIMNIQAKPKFNKDGLAVN